MARPRSGCPRSGCRPSRSRARTLASSVQSLSRCRPGRKPTRCGSTYAGCSSSPICGKSSASARSSCSRSTCSTDPSRLLLRKDGQQVAEAKLKVGDAAPDFDLSSDEGTHVKLSDQRGKRVVLFFYPKDDTPGCTRQACGLRDNYASFQTNN